MANEPLTVTIPADLATALRAAVEAGEYGSIDAALAEAIGAWSRRQEDMEEELAWVRAKTRASLADPDPDLTEGELDERLNLIFKRAGHRNDEAA
jgi:Arc/MetJ-type ribon-helix-helix transcriptional regulator